jgi:hypothetical protein
VYKLLPGLLRNPSMKALLFRQNLMMLQVRRIHCLIRIRLAQVR